MARQGNQTPVTRTGSIPPGNTRISKPARSASRPKRPPGRPFKLPRSASASSSRSGRSERPSASPSVAPTPPRRVLSMLEALPRELIEHIFLYSLNLNLPRASPSLAAALSREHIYKLLIILAFWDDPPDTNPGSEAIDRILVPLDYKPLTLDQRAKLQQDVFRCRFCTLDRVREQIPNMMILTIHRHWINAGMVMEPDQQKALERFMERKSDIVHEIQAKGPPIKRLPEMIGNPEMLRRANIPGPHEYELCINPMMLTEIRSKTMGTIVTWPAIQLVHFPPNLLRGGRDGFSPADVEFLEMLRVTSNNTAPPPGSPLSPSTSTRLDRTALHEGVTKAIRTLNFAALETLFKIDELICRFEVYRTEDSVLYMFPSDHYLTVTRLACDPIQNVRLFQTLLRACAESLPVNNQEIRQWTLDIVDLAEKDPVRYGQIGKFARWFSDFYLRLEEQIDWAKEHPTGALFCLGQLDLHDIEGRKYMDDVLGPGQRPPANYLHETSFNARHWWLKRSGPEVPPGFVRSPRRTGA
ncbi:uncharacterized protein N7498_004736 [Penicillium cinerascens]|uniref:Uncharacterized protein n=1 Tax=Penicillium cinerascens TaxID=70096 RepID=A0A9W9MMF5_9EURO|nr:uncharacterized protein N7498_004736 [Penicillium cinerascens]KAJ5203857.1 hypothetical protein N7498_004736 [Penicillium cinerascens]